MAKTEPSGRHSARKAGGARACRALIGAVAIAIAAVGLRHEGRGHSHGPSNGHCPPAVGTSGTGAAAVLTPVSGVARDHSLTLRYNGTSGGDQRIVRFRVAGQLAADPRELRTALAGDLLPPNGEGAIGMDKIPVGPMRWSTLDCSLLELPVGVRTNSSSPGSYDGVVSIAGGGITPATLPVHITLRGAVLRAVLTLLVGVLLGYLTKWWQAVGTLLRSQLDRQRRIERQVSKDFRSDLVPSGLEELLQSARQAAESFNGAALKQTLDVIEPPYTRLVANAGRLLNTLQQDEAAADDDHSRGRPQCRRQRHQGHGAGVVERPR